MAIAIDETKGYLLDWAKDIAEGSAGNAREAEEAYLLQAVDALDLLDEALAEATSLSDEVAEALQVSKALFGESVATAVGQAKKGGLILP